MKKWSYKTGDLNKKKGLIHKKFSMTEQDKGDPLMQTNA
jgi:hypothetical protein